MRIQAPPSLEALQQEYLQRFIDAIEIAQQTQEVPKFPEYPDLQADDKGRYLHWDEFRRKTDYAEDTRMKWRAVKDQRRKISRSLTLGNFEFLFCFPNSLQAKLHEIDTKCGSHIGTHSLSGFSEHEQEQFLIKSLIMEEAISSSQLEGAATTRKVAKEMLASHRKPKNQDERMIVNNYLLMQAVAEWRHRDLDVDMILELHRIATENAVDGHVQSGMFRTTDDVHVVDNRSGETIHTPPKAEYLPELMQQFCQFANADHSCAEQFIHPVAKAMILHFLIGFIHPFGDGNGRTARALFYWFMLKNRYWLFEYLSISALLKNAPSQYVKAYCYAETDDLDITYFLYHQADIIIRSVKELMGYIQRKQQESRNIKLKLAHAGVDFGLNQRQIGILQMALEEGGRIFTAVEIANLYDVSRNTALGDLNAMSDLKLLLKFQSGKTYEYISPKDLSERIKQK